MLTGFQALRLICSLEKNLATIVRLNLELLLEIMISF